MTKTTIPPSAPSTSIADERRAFLQQGAATLGLTLCAGTALTLLNACENTTTKDPNATPTTPTSPTTPGTGGTSAITVMGNVATIDVTMNALRASGGAISERFGTNNSSSKVIVIRTGATQFVAFTSVCTHSACEVALPATSGANLICPCHSSVFSQTGARISGPASGNLRTFTTAFNATTNVLTLTF
jgi:cytochrome b6-f complex iron-sulfur subunit